MTDNTDRNRAIILVDHGSRRDEANAMLEDVAAMLRGLTSDPVYPAHMELAEPTIQQAFDAAVASGAAFVMVFPYFLSPGRHSREDIPRLCADAATKHPGVDWHCAGPIGPDPMMAELVLRRLRQCDESGFDCEDCTNSSCDRKRH